LIELIYLSPGGYPLALRDASTMMREPQGTYSNTGAKSASLGRLQAGSLRWGGQLDSWHEKCAGQIELCPYTGPYTNLENEMQENSPQARIVLTTESTLDEANKLGRTLVEERLVACATLLPVVQSIYHWNDQLQSSPETMVLLKTSSHKLDALEKRLKELHSYRVPEFLVIPVERGSAGYLEWLFGSVAGAK
jgi:periplasmic divalent cation tolerance protein